jgi:hypothetical protein
VPAVATASAPSSAGVDRSRPSKTAMPVTIAGYAYSSSALSDASMRSRARKYIVDWIP